MNLFEYEGKEILRKFNITTPAGQLLNSGDDFRNIHCPCVAKAQVLSGGRGKAGGVKLCQDTSELQEQTKKILDLTIKGKPVCGLLAEEALNAEKEFYISITLQGVAVPTLIVSCMGGMDIEQVSKTHPEEIIKLDIDPLTGLKEYQKKYIAQKLAPVNKQSVIDFLNALEKAFFNTGAKLIEINPLGVINGHLIAMDAKISLDDYSNAAQPIIAELESQRKILPKYDEQIKEQTTITYVPLKGDVGLISDGAGTGMLTLDLLYDEGLSVGSFCELGGMTTEEVMYRALEVTLTGHPEIQGVLIVLIGGFNRMDNMARGISKYIRDHNVKIPILTRMCGTEEEIGLQIMQEASLETYYSLTEAVKDFSQRIIKG